LGDGDGNIGLEIARAELADFLDVIPENGDGFGFDGAGQELADADQILIQVARPEEGEFLNPAVVLAEEREGSFEFGKSVEGERNAFEIEIDGVLVAVNVVVKHGEPFALERREAHQTKRVSEGAVETVFNEFPGERCDRGGETLGGFVAGPARGNRRDRAGLEEEELVRSNAPFDVLGEVEVVFDAKG